MKRNAFSLVELMVVVAILAVLLAVLLPAFSQVRRTAKSANCLSNLRQLYAAFHLYAEANRGILMGSATEEPWDELLREHVPGDEYYICPSDESGFGEMIGLSYAWRDDFEVDHPDASMAGRKLAVIGPPTLALVFEAVPGWHDPLQIQAASLDGSARAYKVGEFEENLAQEMK